MNSVTAISALALAGHAAAFWRMPCRSTTGVARMDPLVAPNDVADHAHIVFGGGNFGLNTTFHHLAKSSNPELDCTSCEVIQDKSAYWTPPIYFQHQNGTVEMVPNVGGMLAYYLFYLDNVEPFPEGFAMIAGNPAYRNFTGPQPDTELSSWPTYPEDQFFLQQRAIGVNCLNYARAPEASLYRHKFPPKDYMDANCADGIRMEMAFPSCGTGELDSHDHRSHVAYPSLVKQGNCPRGYDHHYPFLFYETIYATQTFAGMPGQFLVSTGDPVGTSYHADFIMGWDSSEFLGKAIDTCTSETGLISDCPLFTIQDDSKAAQCKFPMPEGFDDDECAGPREGLPINVPIQYGPEPATKYPVAGAKGVKTTSLPQTTAPASYQSNSDAPTYSPADPESTKSAPGGIIAPAAPPSSSSAPAVVTSAPTVTSAPAYITATSDDGITTTYITKGHEVIELVIEENEVTVTATPTGYGSAPAGYAHKHKRHLDKHAKRHHNKW